jgi:amidase
MARDVSSLAMLLETQSGFAPCAPLSIAGHALTVKTLVEFDGKNKRLGWLGDLNGYLPVERGILDVCHQGLRRLEGIGCGVEPTPLGFAPERVWDAWLVWRKALVATRIAPFLLQPANRDRIKPEALWEYDSAKGLSSAEFMHASATRSSFYQHLLSLFETYDYLALPCTQVWPFAVQERWPQQILTANGPRSMDTYHRWMESVIYATFAGLPCISMPCGFNAAGLPMGMQIIGKPQDDLGVLQLAYAYEQYAQAILNQAPPLKG